MNFSEPLISVLLPVYNGFPFLPATVESVCRQTEQRWVMYAINDGSTDESAAWLDTLSDPRIQVIHQANQGLSQTLNDGVQCCQTKYIARLDADDICHPERFAKQLEYMESHPEIGLLGTQIRRLGSRRTDRGSHLPADHDAILKALMAGQHAICHPTIMCRREAFLEVGDYKPCVGEDWDIYLRFAERWKLANHPDCLLDYRFHSGSINGARMSEMRRQIRFHCENARLRNANQEEISLAAFNDLERAKGRIWNWRQRMEDLSRARYHAATASVLGEHPIRGWLQMAGAALTAPHLTMMRIGRRFRKG